MFIWSSALAASALAALVLPVVPSFAPAPPRALIGHYNGNLGINTPLWDLTNGDVPAAVVAAAPPAPVVFGAIFGNLDNAKAVVGQQWGPILNIGTCAGGPGAVVVRMRTTCINGPNTTLLGGCVSEILNGGALLGLINAPHNGVISNIPNQLIPAAALGSSWAAQALVRGATTAGTPAIELSSALYGVVGLGF
jgi:hypothetical protein